MGLRAGELKASGGHPRGRTEAELRPLGGRPARQIQSRELQVDSLRAEQTGETSTKAGRMPGSRWNRRLMQHS